MSLVTQPGLVSGNVYDAESGAPIVGANVVVCDTRAGVVAGPSGGFVITSLRPGEYRLAASHVGFEPETVSVPVGEGQAKRIEFRLRPVVLEMQEVEVQGTAPEREGLVTTRVVTSDELRYRAGGFVQDPVRSLSFLPGVSHSARGEWSGTYAVRGGDPDESKVYFGNTELMWPFHLLGFSSVINPDLVDAMEFYPSVFPVRFGGALSSVTVVKPKLTNKGEGAWAYDPMNMKASYAGSYDDIRFLASLRRTFYFVVFGPLGAGRDNRPTYSDLTAEVEIPMGQNHKAQATVVHGSDHIITNLRELQEDMTESGTSVSAGLVSELGFVRSELTVFSNSHDFSLNPSLWWGTATTRQHDMGVRLDLTSTPVSGMLLSAGFEGGQAGFDGNLLDQAGFTRSDAIGAGYVSARWLPVKELALDAGLRYEAVRWTLDRLLEPRLVAALNPAKGMQFTAGYRRSSQQPYSFLSRSTASVVFDNDYSEYEMFRAGAVGAKQADHYSVSGDFELSELTRLSVEGYWKDYTRLPTWSEGQDGRVYGFGNSGFGQAQGVELVLEQKAVRGWSGWLTYALSWARKQQGSDTTLHWDHNDRRHSLNLIARREFRGDWTWTTTFHLHTGAPYTPLTHFRSPDAGIEEVNRGPSRYTVSGAKNSLRVPTYHRLDMKLQKDLPHLPLRPYIYIEVLNLYNRENVYHLVQFETLDGRIATGRFTGIQLTPLFGIGGRF
ncbi:MAG: TonB-dependent receptor [candidate division WOR-3 bacterium]|nr:MAG: TonB-dependent receptor [candidate division WOR-3 bacterium]